MDISGNLLSLSEYENTCKQIGKTWCRLYKNREDVKNVFIKYCDNHKANTCFELFYVRGLSAEDIAAKENIDRRTVFKYIDSEVLKFGIWLEQNFNLYSLYKTYSQM